MKIEQKVKYETKTSQCKQVKIWDKKRKKKEREEYFDIKLKLFIVERKEERLQKQFYDILNDKF